MRGRISNISPIQAILKTRTFIALLLALPAFAADPKPAADSDDLSYIYILMKDNDRPKFDYEGEGIMRNATYERPDPKVATYKFEVIAIKLGPTEAFIFGGANDKPEKYVVKFTGELTRTGDDQIQVKGTVESKIKGAVQFSKMSQENGKADEEFPEIPFNPGTTKVEFKGKVLGWYPKTK